MPKQYDGQNKVADDQLALYKMVPKYFDLTEIRGLMTIALKTVDFDLSIELNTTVQGGVITEKMKTY